MGNCPRWSTSDNAPTGQPGCRTVRPGDSRTRRRDRARMDRKVNGCERSLNVVNVDQPKAQAPGWSQRQRRGHRDCRLPGRGPAVRYRPSRRTERTYPVRWHARNVVNPLLRPEYRAGQPQGELKGQRAEEGGKSESRPVTGRIGPPAAGGDTHPERGQTSTRSCGTREFEKPAREESR